MPKPILSIIVPTRNRARYAIPLIKSLVSIESEDLEIVLHDNSDSNDLDTFIKTEINDSRLVYRHTKERLDATANFDKALECSHGDYITFIGDDDGVNPEIVRGARWAKQHEFDAVVTTRPAQYRWPDKKERIFGFKQAGELTIRQFTGKSIPADSEAAILKCARMAGSNITELPKIYYGIAKSECLEIVRRIAGTCFPGPSPDLSGAVALASFVKSMRIIDYPLFLPGASAAGVAGWISRGTHQGRLKDYPHLPKRYVQSWSKIVPRYFSGSTIWGEDVVQALLATGRQDVLRKFNVPLLHAKCAAYNPAFINITLGNFYPALRKLNQKYSIGSLLFIYYYLSIWAIRGKFLVSNIKHICGSDKDHIIRNLNDIGEATKAMQKYLSDNGRRFEDNI